MYLLVAITLALGNDDIRNMPKTRDALHTLYGKIDRTYKMEANPWKNPLALSVKKLKKRKLIVVFFVVLCYVAIGLII